MKRFSPLMTAGFMLLVVACNTVEDKQVTPADVVPESAVQAVRDKFPNATNITFKTLEPNTLWQAIFDSQSKPVQSAVTAREMIVASQTIGAVPDSIKRFVDQTNLVGGQFVSDYKQQVSWQSGSLQLNYYTADYLWKGKTFTIGFSAFSIGTNSAKQSYNTLWAEDQTTLTINSNDPTQLPASIKQVITAQSLTVIPGSYIENPVSIQIAQDGSKTYYVRASRRLTATGPYNSFIIVFDNDGKYIYTQGVPLAFDSTNNPGQPIDGSAYQKSTRAADVPAVIQQAIQGEPEYTGAIFQQLERYDLYGKTTYKIQLMRPKVESWELYFDEQGKPLDRKLTYLIF